MLLQTWSSLLDPRNRDEAHELNSGSCFQTPMSGAIAAISRPYEHRTVPQNTRRMAVKYSRGSNIDVQVHQTSEPLFSFLQLLWGLHLWQIISKG